MSNNNGMTKRNSKDVGRLEKFDTKKGKVFFINKEKGEHSELH